MDIYKEIKQELLVDDYKNTRFMRFSNGGGNAPAGDDPPPDPNPAPTSFDDILKDEKYLTEFNKRLNDAINAAEEKWKTKNSQALTDAQKLKNMTDAEREKYIKEETEKELNRRIADVTARELKAEAKDILADKGLPKDLIELVSLSDEENCKKSIDTLESVFKKAVSLSVEEKIKKSSGTPKAGKEQITNGVDEAFYRMNPNLR